MSELNAVTRLREWARESPVNVAELAGPFGMDSEKRTLTLLLAKALAAHKQIKDRPNQVCAEYELCSHVVCQSSYIAFAIADLTITDISAELKRMLPEPTEEER